VRLYVAGPKLRQLATLRAPLRQSISEGPVLAMLDLSDEPRVDEKAMIRALGLPLAFDCILRLVFCRCCVVAYRTW
jgi:hypothetical protein